MGDPVQGIEVGLKPGELCLRAGGCLGREWCHGAQGEEQSENGGPDESGNGQDHLRYYAGHGTEVSPGVPSSLFSVTLVAVS